MKTLLLVSMRSSKAKPLKKILKVQLMPWTGLSTPPTVSDLAARLGLLSEQTVVGGTFQDAMANILGEQLAYGTGERDLVLLQHAFEVAKSDGSRETINMTLVRTGTPNGHSAMAVTVGLPAAMAAKLVARGGCDHGVLRPLAKSIYEPLLEELAANGVTYTTDIRKVRQ